jgi:hypothetical protein
MTEETKFDRSQFKGAKLSTLKETKEKADEKNVRLLGGEGNNRPGFHSVEDGRNVFRIMPPHNSEDSAYQPLRTSTLECDVPEFKDGKETGKTEEKRKKIFIATVHGNEALKNLNKDPIELFIKYVSEMAGTYQDKDERQKFLAPVTGYRGKDQKWVWGIMPSASYVCYASDTTKKLGRLELWDKWIKEMDKITAKIEEEETEPLDRDPFSNPDEGYPLTIDKDEATDKSGKKLPGKWDYTIDRLTPKKRQSWDDFCEEHMVTDEQLKDLKEKESLRELYVDVYTTRDFDLALNGLHIFDKRYKYNIFENDEFIKELIEIQALVPEPKKDDTSDIDKAFEGKVKKAGEDVKNWNKRKCKEHLKAYVLDTFDDERTENYLDTIEEFDIDQLQEWCTIVESGKKLPELNSKGADVKAPDGTQSSESSEEDELTKLTANRRRRS